MSTHRHHVLELPTPLMWEEHVDNFIVFLRSQGLVATSIRTKRNHVLQLARAFPDTSPTDLDPGSLVEWCGLRTWANETRHAYYSTFRKFFGWLDSTSHCGNIAAVLPRIRRPSGAPRPIPDSVLVDCVDRASPRDALILRLAAEAGLRCVEIAQVEAGDVYEDADGWNLFVRGKGGRTRTVPITADLARGACQFFCVWGLEVGGDSVGVGGGELGEGLFPVGGGASLDEACGGCSFVGGFAGVCEALGGSFVFDVADGEP